MRRRMQELAAGVYEREGPRIRLSEERLVLTASENEVKCGSFQIESTNQISMRGIVISDNPRMKVLNPDFSGTAAEVHYQFYTDGMVEGDIQKGNLYLICNKNEYTLSFVVSISAGTLKVDGQEIASLEDYVQFARHNFEKAYQLFCSSEFLTLLRKQPVELLLLARSLAYESAPRRNMEEFLLSAGLKDPVTCECRFEDRIYENPKEDIREILEITRSTWGYANISLYTEGSFLAVPFTEVSEEEIMGNTCRVPVFLLADKLHSGTNYGRLFVTCENDTFVYTFTVHKDSNVVREPDLREDIVELIRLYVNFRTGKLMPATWANETLKVLNHILADGQEHVLAELAKAQVLLLSDRGKEAQWLLDQNKQVLKDTNSVEYGYYLYVTTLLNSEKEYVHKVAGELQRLHLQQKENPIIFWMLLFTGESYENNLTRKYRALKGFCLLYSRSPVFYAEAYALVREKPELLMEGGEFEVRLLYWAYRRELLTKEIGYFLASEGAFLRGYYPLLTPVIKYYYQTYGGDDFLKTLCSHYISGGRFEKELLPYYQRAVEGNLKIYGLFEAYVRCAFEAGKLHPTGMLQYYLPFVENLPFDQQAAVYAGVIQNREKQATLYFQCKEEMEQFALKQLSLGHMDENLGVLYDFYFSQVPLTEEMAHQLAPLLYVHKLTLEDERMQWVVVVNRSLNRISKYPIHKKMAYFPIYSKDRVIAFEDGYGRRYVKSVEYDLMLLMPSESLTRKCMRLSHNEMPYLIHFFDYERLQETRLSDVSEEELAQIPCLLQSEVLTSDYRKQLHPVLLQFYCQEEKGRELDCYLEEVSFGGLAKESREQVCELLIERGFYDKAMEGVLAYGCLTISATSLLSLCTEEIKRRHKEANEGLIYLCSLVFQRGKYNGVLLEYLVNHLEGSTRSLYELWMSAMDFEVGTFPLEERLLVQMLYTDVFVSRSDDILISYMKGGGEQLVCDAYLSYFAYQYFALEAPANAMVMEQLFKRLQAGRRLHLCLKFALLSYLAESGSKEIEWMQSLYDDFILKGYVFGFYEKLPSLVRAHFPRAGKQAVEFRTGKNKQITIRYLHTDYAGNNFSDQEYQVEQMEEMYEGIYVKEITLFYGDTVQYYISEEKEGRSNILSSGQLSERNISSQEEGGALSRINGLIISDQLGENEVFGKHLVEYDTLVRQAAKEFVWIR